MTALLALFALLASMSPVNGDEFGLLAVSISDEVVAADTVPAEHTHLPAAAAVIAACESGEIRADGSPVVGTYSLTAEHPVSSASGKYQFVDSTWGWVTGLEPPASAYPEDVQDEAFVELWDDGTGRSHWEPSVGCWGGRL